MQNSHDTKANAKEDDGDHRKTGNTKVLSRTTIANLGKSRTNTSLKVDHSKDKELINSGLHKLVSTFNTAKVGQRASKMATTKKNDSKLSMTAPETIPEKQTDSHIVLTKQVSIDKYTMTDFKDNERPVALASTVFKEQEQPYTYQGRDLQWTDPRLLKKYALAKQQYKKSMTVPYVNKSEYGTEILEGMSEEEEEEETELLSSRHKHIILKCLYCFCTASVSFIGTMCGITLITVVLWKILDENILNFQLMEPQRHNFFFTRQFTNLVGSIFYLINAVFGKILRVITSSTKEVFTKDDELSWYQRIY